MIRPLCRFEAVGGAKWSMNALVCAIPTMRISTVVLGKAVSNAEISGHHVITKLMRKIQSIGQNIERWERDKVQIPGTKIALERAILDTLWLSEYRQLIIEVQDIVEEHKAQGTWKRPAKAHERSR